MRGWAVVHGRAVQVGGAQVARQAGRHDRRERFLLSTRGSRYIAAIALEGILSLFIASRVHALAEAGPIRNWGAGVEPTTSPADSTAVDEADEADEANEVNEVNAVTEASARLTWRHSHRFENRGEAGFSAIAADPDGGWLAAGGATGLTLGRPFRDPRARTLALEGIRDLRFAGDGTLYIATARGFWLLSDLATGRASALRESSPATGAAARRVNRIATAPGFIALATDDGAFVASLPTDRPLESRRNADLNWVRLDAGFPTGPVTAIAAETRPEASYLWAIVGPALWRVHVSPAGVVLDAREVLVPGRPHGKLPVDLVTNLPGGVVALVYPASIFYRVRGAPDRRNVWEIERPVLPPGASIARLGHWPGRFWLATDRGLLLSHSKAGPWRRAAPPAGRAAAYSAAALNTRFFVAGASGLLYAETAAAVSTRAPRASRRPAPAIAAVHRVALRQQGLESKVFDAAWRGVRRRGWYPALALRLEVDHGEGRARDDDEVFVSGAYHRLRDSDRDRNLDLGASLTMTWDLRDLAFEPEQIALSREARLVIGLRDDVLDEVNQLYFERLAVESELAQLRSGSTPEPVRGLESESAENPATAFLGMRTLELRLEEVTAGLDAWTGGWFSEQLERFPAEGM